MKIMYSPSSYGFYSAEMHKKIPEDAIEITRSEHQMLLAGAGSGKLIVMSEGRPTLIDRTASAHELGVSERAWRDREMLKCFSIRDRHRDQIEAGIHTDMTQDCFVMLLVFIQALRDWPQSDRFPDKDCRPLTPDMLLDFLDPQESE